MGGAEAGVDETVRSIQDMSVRGAGKIARAASSAIANFARGWEGNDIQQFLGELRDVARKLYSTRPTAVSLRNGILLTLKGAQHETDVESARNRVILQSEDFIKEALRARERIAEIGAKRIPNGSTVLTHCNSMAALTTIQRAYGEGRVNMVFSTESRPWRQGHLTTRWLLDRDIPVTMIVDSAVRHFMRDINAVVVGADTIAANGAVINKIGTSQIALIAHETRVPFIVCAETFKFSRETLMGSLVEIEDRGPAEIADPKKPEDFPGARFRNPVFDVTPPEYVDVIVTELGIVSPYLATEVIREMFGIEGPISIEGRRNQFKWLWDHKEGEER